ncbi:hypothetical protein B0A48_12656 [Cryoendolithus antarcticus]|uniref:Endopeptidase Clp n=1 Tax=Cryoendolithus antarcticus TaxID=1507870 RepID=A0A1V8SRB4_9PEZI|nr:hypothetical protein B0A48_12656 [Cryoendolithus antarcticus]
MEPLARSSLRAFRSAAARRLLPAACRSFTGFTGLPGGHNGTQQKPPSSALPMPYVTETGGGWHTSDIFSRLLKERIICLNGEVEEVTSASIVAQLLFLESEAPNKPINLYINSPGGSVTAGLAIYDTIQYIQSPVTTICLGQAASMGSLLLCGGEKGQRYCLPHSRIMVHQVSGGYSGQATDIAIHAKEILRVREQLNKIYQRHLTVEKSLEEIGRVMERDFFMSAEEALEWGIIDKVLGRRDDVKEESTTTQTHTKQISKMAQPTQLAFRTSKHIGVLDAAPVYEQLPGFVRPEGNLRCCTYSPDGRFFAYASPDAVTVVDASVGHLVTTLPAQNVYQIGFSHAGTYIITWQQPTKDEDGNATKNLKIWRTIDDNAGESGERDMVGKFVQKSQTGWNLQYTHDEQYCARCVNNEVQFFKSDDLSTVWNHLRVEGVSDFALSPGAQNSSVAVFVPERKGQPAAVKVFAVPDFETPKSQKSFFKGDKVQLKWNSQGTSLIVLAQTEVDKSNKSYYGETNMYILSANGGFDSRIQLDKEGPIHDVTWSPSGKEFGVVYGYMPAKTTIFNQRAVAQHSFSLGPRNTILFSPHGRFVLVAGFGNLAGQMDIYDLEKNYEKVCTIEASNASVCEWSPDGRHILTATTSPRLRVDNAIRIWHVQGGLMYNEEMHELYHVIWRPQTTAQHPLENPLHPAPAPHPSAMEFLGKVKTPSKPAGAYRPPGARGTATPLAFKREDEGGAAFIREMMSGKTDKVNGFGGARRQVPGAETVEPAAATNGTPGAVPAEGDENLSKAALKNKKKREAKKAKDAEAKTAGLAPAPATNGNGDASHAATPSLSPSRQPSDRPRSRSKTSHDQTPRTPSDQRTTPKPTPAPITTTPAKPPGLSATPQHLPPADDPPELSVTSPLAGTPNEKKIRSLLKKLRAIDDLRMRQAGGEKLEGTQVLKIGSEVGVRKELEGLGWRE